MRSPQRRWKPLHMAVRSLSVLIARDAGLADIAGAVDLHGISSVRLSHHTKAPRKHSVFKLVVYEGSSRERTYVLAARDISDGALLASQSPGAPPLHADSRGWVRRLLAACQAAGNKQASESGEEAAHAKGKGRFWKQKLADQGVPYAVDTVCSVDYASRGGSTSASLRAAERVEPDLWQQPGIKRDGDAEYIARQTKNARRLPSPDSDSDEEYFDRARGNQAQQRTAWCSWCQGLESQGTDEERVKCSGRQSQFVPVRPLLPGAEDAADDDDKIRLSISRLMIRDEVSSRSRP